MDTKTKIKLLLIQLLILASFVILALGSGEAEKKVIRASAQGGYCGANGFTFIGYYSSHSDCKNACASRGYSQACMGDATTACFCK